MIASRWFHRTKDLEEVYDIRKKALTQEEMDLGLDDYRAYHVVVFEKDKPLGCGSLCFVSGEYILYGVAVLEQYRKNGYGDLIIRMLIRKVFDLHANKLIAYVPEKMVRFFEKYQFSIENCDKPFSIEGLTMMRCCQDVGGDCQ